MNSFIDFDRLIEQVANSDPHAIAEFTDVMAEILPQWLREIGFREATVASETPACLLSLILLVTERRGEIQNGRVIGWLREQTRNLTVRFWREVDEQSSPRVLLTAGRVWREVDGLGGSRQAYRRAARRLGVRSGWLRRRHREIRARLTGGEQ